MPRKPNRAQRKRMNKFRQEVASRWDGVLLYAEQHPTYRQWRDIADECYSFYNGQEGNNPGKFFGVGLREEPDMLRQNPFKVTVNKVFEFARTVEPELYHRDPIATVVERRRAPESAKQLAEIMEDILSYYLEEMDTFSERRAAIKDALVTGRGVLMTSARRLPDGMLMPQEEHIPFSDFLMDPDARSYREITWMARRHRTPKVKLIELFGDKAQKLFSESNSPNEIIEWWEIYSRSGLFGGLSGENVDTQLAAQADKDYGKYLRIAMVRPPQSLSSRETVEILEDTDVAHHQPYVLEVGEWPVAFYEESDSRNGWPFTLLDLYPQSDKVYPMSPVKPALPEQRAINWAFIFLLNAMMNTSRSLVQLHPDVEESDLERIQKSVNFAIVRGNEGNQDLFKVLPLKQDNSSLWNEFMMIVNQFDVRIGLLDMRAAISGAEARSAAAAQFKDRMATKTIDAFFSVVTRAFTHSTRKLAYVLRTEAKEDDLVRIVGPEDAEFWRLYHEAFEGNPIRDLDVAVWADGMRRPTREVQQQQALTLFETAAGLASSIGDLETINHYWVMLHKKLGIPPGDLKVFARPEPEIDQEALMQQMMEEQAAAAEQEAAAIGGAEDMASPEEEAEARAAAILANLPEDIDVVTEGGEA